MSFGGNAKSLANETAAISALKIQTSVYGASVPVVIGKTRITGNLLWYGDLKAYRHEEKQGGKGGGGMSSVSYGYRYSLQIGICEGPATVADAWMLAGQNKTRLSAAPQWGYTVYPGNTPNTAPTTLESRHPDQFFKYPGLCNFVTVDIGEFTSDTPPSYSFEVVGFEYDSGLGGANPAAAVSRIITDTRWGAGAPATAFPMQTEYGAYACALGLQVSIGLTEQRTAAEWVEEITRQTHAVPVWAADHMTIVPRGDTAVSGNGYSWSPNVTPLFDLTDDDYLGDSAEPIKIERRGADEAHNIISVEFRNRANEYNTETIDGSDPADVAMQGARKGKDTIQAHGLVTPEAAGRLGDLEVQRSLQVRNTYSFTLTPRFAALLPMDVVTLTDGPLGMDKTPVRLTRVTETATGEIDCEAEDFPAGAGHAAQYTRQPIYGYIPNHSVDPGNCVAPVIFEAPANLAAGTLEVWAAVTGASENWGGATVWISQDGSTYARAGTVRGGSRYGTLATACSAGATTLDVQLAGLGGQLLSGTAADAAAGNTLIWLDGEYVGYQTATLTATNRYTLTGVVRGLNGTSAGAHPAGASWARAEAVRVASSGQLPVDRIGQTIYLKFTSTNIYQSAEQDLADVGFYTYVISGAQARPPSVGGFAFTPLTDGTRTFTWSAAGLPATAAEIEIRYSTSTTAWASMSVLGRAPAGAGRAESAEPNPGTYNFAARYVSTQGAVSASVALIAGAVLGAKRLDQALIDNSYAVIGQNGLPNTDQTSAMTWGYASKPMTPVIELTWSSSVGGFTTDNYVLAAGQTRNVVSAQAGPGAGGDSALAWDAVPSGSWSRDGGVSVVPGERICFSCYVQTHRCNKAIGIGFFDAAGADVGGGTISASVAPTGGLTNALSGYDRLFVIATAPAGAVSVNGYVRKYNTIAGQTSSYIWYAAPQIEKLSANAAGPSPYMPGPASNTRQLGYTGDLNATLGAPAGTLVAGITAETVATAATNFNASNDRNAAAVTAPTIAGDGTAVDHALQTDGSADISFEWLWGGTEGDIDGFHVFVYQSASNGAYTFGTTPAAETVFQVPAVKRAFVLYGVAADKYYTFGVRAYRAVDKDIAASGVIQSAIVKPAAGGENPYQPSASVAFAGNVIGTIDGVAPSGVKNSNITLTGSGGTVSISGAGGGSVTGIVMPGNPINPGNVATLVDDESINKDQIKREEPSVTRSTYLASDTANLSGNPNVIMSLTVPDTGMTTTSFVVNLSGTISAGADLPSFRLATATSGGATVWQCDGAFSLSGTSWALSEAGSMTAPSGPHGTLYLIGSNNTIGTFKVLAGSSFVMTNSR
jgi:hypothetical protein